MEYSNSKWTETNTIDLIGSDLGRRRQLSGHMNQHEIEHTLAAVIEALLQVRVQLLVKGYDVDELDRITNDLMWYYREVTA